MKKTSKLSLCRLELQWTFRGHADVLLKASVKILDLISVGYFEFSPKPRQLVLTPLLKGTTCYTSWNIFFCLWIFQTMTCISALYCGKSWVEKELKTLIVSEVILLNSLRDYANSLTINLIQCCSFSDLNLLQKLRWMLLCITAHFVGKLVFKLKLILRTCLNLFLTFMSLLYSSIYPVI